MGGQSRLAPLFNFGKTDVGRIATTRATRKDSQWVGRTVCPNPRSRIDADRDAVRWEKSRPSRTSDGEIATLTGDCPNANLNPILQLARTIDLTRSEKETIARGSRGNCGRSRGQGRNGGAFPHCPGRRCRSSRQPRLQIRLESSKPPNDPVWERLARA